jgi:hypothetical protein
MRAHGGRSRKADLREADQPRMETSLSRHRSNGRTLATAAARTGPVPRLDAPSGTVP